eukprot:TRINITY_DN7009_c0_g6_i1.p1 TRINITY_DN7009_c0_g6~~TRINITY_DN7009_c0_g6_i1.p1  ORF type:complete len:1930 (-),score=350.59 TRINITY_DN7009_c0_g6_i1:266-5218(-)
MSLNRRLYGWLLNGNEGTNVEYFLKYAKDIVVKAVKLTFSYECNDTTAVAKPYKLIMPLLDKEEVGSAIIEELLVDVLRPLLKYKDGHSFFREVSTWVTRVIDALQPRLLWETVASLLNSQLAEVAKLGDSIEALELIDTLLDNLPLKDIKTQFVFLPTLLVDLIKGLSVLTREIAKSQATQQTLIANHLHTALQLTLKIIGKIYPPESHSQSLADSDDNQEKYISLGERTTKIEEGQRQYEAYYTLLVEFILPLCGGIQMDENLWDLSCSGIYLCIFDLSCQLLVTIHTHFCKTYDSQVNTPVPARADRKGSKKEVFAEIKPDELPSWFDNVVKCSEAANPQLACFGIHTFISFVTQPNSAISDSQQKRITSSRLYTVKISRKLWQMSKYSSYLSTVHYQVAELFLKIRTLCEEVVGTVIAEDLLQADVEKRVDGYQRFALLWRLTGEISSSERAFSNSLFLMLDALNDDQPLVRLAGRTWLADSINKLERILDPLLLVLLDPTTARADSVYQTTYDARRVLYIFSILRNIIECDFRMFMQYVAEKPISKDILALNSKQVISETGEALTDSEFLFIPVENYIDLLIVTSLRFTQGRVLANVSNEFHSLNSVVQTTSAEFLQYFISKIVHIPKAISLATMILDPILQNLAQSVSTANLVLQVQLLALLRTMVYIYARSPHDSAVNPIDSLCTRPMFLQTVTIGLLQPSSKNIRVYWLEFLTSCMPYFVNHLAILVVPIVEVICELLRSFENAHDSISSRDVLLLLKTLVMIFQLCAQNVALIEKSLDEQQHTHRVPGRFLVDFVKERVFASDSGPTEFNPQILARQELFKYLHIVLAALVKVWGQPRTATAINSVVNKAVYSPPTTDELHNKYVIQDVILKIIDPLMFYYPNQLVSAILQLWSQCRTEPREIARQKKAVLIEMLNTSSSTTNEAVLHAAAGLLASVSAKAKANQLQPPKEPEESPFTDMTILGFINTYTRFCVAAEGKIAATWPSILTLIREGLNNPYGCLPLISILDNFVRRSNQPLEDKRLKREAHDLTQRLVDACVGLAIKTNVEGLTSATFLEDEDDDQSVQLQVSEFFAMQPLKKQETPKRSRSSSTSSSTIRRGLSNNLANLASHLSNRAFLVLTNKVPAMLDQLLSDDKDRVASVFVGVVYAILPFLKKPSSNYAVANMSIGLIAALCDYPYCLRAWRKEILDIFNDPEFFTFDQEALPHWKKVINHLMTKDKTAFQDVVKMLNKYLTAHQSLMFVSVEQENVIRANLLKRLAFIIYSGEFDQYLSSLPIFQEKLVEALKVPQASYVYIQVFLCMRVLLTKISRDKLRAFWPVILTEMMRVFGNPVVSKPPLVLAASKFLDLVLILPPEQFNVYEWMFITDTFENNDRPSPSTSNASSSNTPPPVQPNSSPSIPVALPSFYTATSTPRKPSFVPYIEILAQQGKHYSLPFKLNPPNPHLRQPQIMVRSVDEMDQLTTYLSKFSLYAYINCVSGNPPDYVFIDTLLGTDFIDGQVELEQIPLGIEDDTETTPEVVPFVQPKRKRPHNAQILEPPSETQSTPVFSTIEAHAPSSNDNTPLLDRSEAHIVETLSSAPSSTSSLSSASSSPQPTSSPPKLTLPVPTTSMSSPALKPAPASDVDFAYSYETGSHSNRT